MRKRRSAGTVFLHDVGVEVENDRDPLVADGVGAELETGRIGLQHAIAHGRRRLHLVESRPRLSGVSVKGSKKYAVREPSEPSA